MVDGHDPHQPEDRDSTLWVVLGAALILAGVFFGARSMGLIPRVFLNVFGDLARARTGIGIVLIGIALIWWARSGHRFSTPVRGTKLYRSRDNKWIAGVLGGLAEYFSLDATLLRLAFIALVVLLDMGALVAVYIVMAIVVPLEPQNPPATYVAAEPQWPTTAPPAPPVPPVDESEPTTSSDS